MAILGTVRPGLVMTVTVRELEAMAQSKSLIYPTRKWLDIPYSYPLKMMIYPLNTHYFNGWIFNS